MTTQETNVSAVVFHEDGVEVSAAFSTDVRQDLDRAHTFFVGFEQEEFGEQARELNSLAKDLAWELLHGYRRQPKAREAEDA